MITIETLPEIIPDSRKLTESQLDALLTQKRASTLPPETVESVSPIGSMASLTPKSTPKIFLAVYTHCVKAYVDQLFFTRLGQIVSDSDYPVQVGVVVNSVSGAYDLRVRDLMKRVYCEWSVSKVAVDFDPVESVFHRRIVASANKLRDDFLKSDCNWFFILESDVIPQVNVINKLIDVALNEPLDVVGGLYYEQEGFHARGLRLNEAIVDRTSPVLSGCTMYSRDVIASCPFRFDANKLGAFPDALIAEDATKLGYVLANYTGVRCKHIPGGQQKTYERLWH